MAIQITYNGGVYEINGLLNSQNGESLKNHFETLMIHSNAMVLSLNKVLDIDCNAANILSDLHKKADLCDILFYIIGRENKKVQELFNVLNYHDILL
ncbi:hypothetical protein DR871_005695 [Flavobacterium petrolei]|jgi:anti-anti-sigma regulatory factor|uniref:STAS domain-containing protein n=1 Tax=Flavobacterium petrolei TaxID=2259594 RepID=A0A482TPD3_9FLAO|nr:MULTISPECIES: STAS domain-containing protein [Flavobacterium]QIH39224.1 hypothetical protein G7A72_10570 [Flavobacterium sp. Sr18]RYJ53543.1 hypothetical protein DR871_005695 [Flavobacterium petrolei]